MTWVSDLPSALTVLIGLGALSVALNAMITLWGNLRPKDLDGLKKDVSALRDRLSAAERDLARIDTDAIAGRFDRVERKLDEVTILLLKSVSKA